MACVRTVCMLLLCSFLLASALHRDLLDLHAWSAPLRSDLVVVMPSNMARTSVVHATQRSRRGVRTFVVVDKGPALDGPGLAKKQISLRISHRPQVFGAYKGDDMKLHPARLQELRIALSPFLANSTLGGHSYKWMLFGHDDTVWLLDNVIKMLGGLDPDMPYLITDNIWFGVNGSEAMMHPSPEAPFCLPCRKKGYSDLKMLKEGGVWKCIVNDREAPIGCPCTRASLAMNPTGKLLLDPETLDFRDPKQRSQFCIDSGAGVIMSRGLMALASFDKVQAWMKAHDELSADELLTGAVWELMRIAPTKPGHDFCRPGQMVFDAGWQSPRQRGAGDRGADGGNDPLGVIDRLEGALNEDSRCDKLCHARLDTMLSVHVRQRFALQDLAGGQEPTEHARNNATVALINLLTNRAEAFQRRRWAAEQAYIAAGN